MPSSSRQVLKNPTDHEVVRHLESLRVIQDPTRQRVVSLPRIFHAILEVLAIPITVFTESPVGTRLLKKTLTPPIFRVRSEC